MYADTRDYLLDDLLAKLDRALMAVRLEGRVAILHHRVVGLGPAGGPEVRQRVPEASSPGTSRRPSSIARRMGFEIPWWSGSADRLQRWAADLLASGEFGGDGCHAVTGWQRFSSRRSDPLLVWSHVVFGT